MIMSRHSFGKVKRRVDVFCRLGENWSIDTDDTVIATLEKYLCAIYGYPREKSVNAVRTKLFEKKYAKEGKFNDMSLLPPCNSVLILHIKQANFVAKMWESSLTKWLDPDGISENGCLPYGSTYWVDDIFPRDVEDMRRYSATLCLSMMTLTNLMSKTNCRMTITKIVTMTMMRILIQIAFNTASND